MVNTLFDTVWRDISPFAVGFDRTFDALSIMANSKSQSISEGLLENPDTLIDAGKRLINKIDFKLFLWTKFENFEI